MSDSSESSREWHLDKRVPITLIGVLLIQTAAIIGAWFEMRADVDENRRIAIANQTELALRRPLVTGNQISIGKIETDIQHIREALVRIEEKLDE